MTEKNLLALNLNGKHPLDRLHDTVVRAHEIRAELGRLDSSVDIAISFALIVESFREKLDDDARARFDRNVRVATTLYDAAAAMSEGQLSENEAADLVKKEIAR